MLAARDPDGLASARVEIEGSGGEAVMLVLGSVRSIVHVNEAGLASVLPAASVARTSKVCEPAARPE